MTNINKRLLLSQKNLKEIKEVNENEKEEFKFNNVSDMTNDKSNDKSSTRYDAKFIEEDEMNYDPEMIEPSNSDISR